MQQAECEADKIRQLVMWLADKFTKSLWLYDVSINIREACVQVTNSWLKNQFNNLLQKDEVALKGRMELFLAYLSREKSFEP